MSKSGGRRILMARHVPSRVLTSLTVGVISTVGVHAGNTCDRSDSQTLIFTQATSSQPVISQVRTRAEHPTRHLRSTERQSRDRLARSVGEPAPPDVRRPPWLCAAMGDVSRSVGQFVRRSGPWRAMPLNAGRARVARCGRSAELTISSWWDRVIRDLLAKVKVTGFAESESHVEGDDAAAVVGQRRSAGGIRHVRRPTGCGRDAGPVLSDIGEHLRTVGEPGLIALIDCWSGAGHPDVGHVGSDLRRGSPRSGGTCRS